MNLEILEKFGITPTEAKVYTSIFGLKNIPIGYIIKKTGLHRGTIYNSLNNLIRKGFISFIDKDGKRHYNISGNKIFEMSIEGKKRELDAEKNQIKEIFDNINKISSKGDEQEVEIYQGVESFKNLFLQMYEECKKTNSEYVFMGKGGEMQNAVGENYYKYTQKLKKDLGISCRVVLDRESITHSYHKYVQGNLRYLGGHMSGPANIWIYNDKVLLVMFKTNPLMIIKIKSHVSANSFGDYFEHLWNLSTELDERKDYSKKLAQVLGEAKKLDILSRDRTLPFFIYPHGRREFRKYRSAIEKRKKTLTGEDDVLILGIYKKIWASGKKCRYLISRTSLKYFFGIIKEEFGETHVKNRIEDIKRSLKKYNAELRVSTRENSLNVYITDKKLLLVMPPSNEINSFITVQKEMINTFSLMFEDYWNNSKNILEIFEENKF
jgi:sugar-specific transcriptional regulator TrmB